MTRIEHIGDATLYLGDRLEIAPESHDVLCSDPPYGQNAKVNTFHAGGSRKKAVVQRNGKSLIVNPNVWQPIEGDDKPFDPQPWLQAAPQIILWGAHKFSHR